MHCSSSELASVSAKFSFMKITIKIETPTIITFLEVECEE